MGDMDRNTSRYDHSASTPSSVLKVQPPPLQLVSARPDTAVPNRLKPYFALKHSLSAEISGLETKLT